MRASDQLGHISGGRVLDVATGGGGFAAFLAEGLRDYAEIIGIDADERGATAFRELFKDRPDIRFQKMDGGSMDWPDASFDTACISNSLHHLADPPAVLAEMMRVLRRGGNFIFQEMYRDDQSDAQMTHVLLHHWWAAVDRAKGRYHGETWTRPELVERVSMLGLAGLSFHDVADTDGDPLAPETVEQILETIEASRRGAEGLPGLQEPIAAELMARVRRHGFHGAKALLATGIKG